MALSGAAGCRMSSASRTNVTTSGNGIPPGSRPLASADISSRYKINAGRDVESKTSLAGFRSGSQDRSDGTVPISGRDPKYSKEDILATKEVEFLESFPVTGPDQDAKTEYIRKHLLETKNVTRTKAVLLVVSLSGIKVTDISRQTTMMAHALKRIAFMTCFPEQRQFSFIAREPKANADEQFCHSFLTRTVQEVEELKTLVGSAFRMAYAQSQTDTIPATAGVTQPPTPIPPENSAAQSFHDVIRSQLDTQKEEYEDRRDAMSARLSQISTPHVDRLALERRQKRQRDLAEGAHQRRSSPAAAEDTSPASDVTARNKKSAQSSGQLHGASDSPQFANGSPVTSAGGDGPTSATNGINSAVETALVSNLMRALRCTGNETKSHGSPVMILKELIDLHFSTSGSLLGVTPVTTSEDRASAVTLASSSTHQSAAVMRPDTGVQRKSSPSGRSRPMSGAFTATDEGFLKLDVQQTLEAENGSSCIWSESVANTAKHDEDLRTALWYQPGIPREAVLGMLAQQDVGAFVVRDSTTHSGCYALSLRVPKYDNESGILHYLITKTSRGTVRLKGMSKEWNSLTSLVTHHTVMRELLPCLLVLPHSLTVNGYDQPRRDDSEC